MSNQGQKAKSYDRIGKTQELANSRYGFNIRGKHGDPLLTIVYATKEHSESAEQALRAAIERAIDIVSPYSRF
jgi:hypothetical protein